MNEEGVLTQLNLFEPKLYRCIVPAKDLQGKVETGKFGGPSTFQVSILSLVCQRILFH